MRKTWLSALAVAALWWPSIRVAAEDAKPIVAVSVASIDKALEAVDTIGDMAGVKSFTDILKLQAAAFTQGIDGKRPIGMVLLPTDSGVTGYGFVPVSNLKQVMNTLKGEEKDGVWEVTPPGSRQTMYVKESKGWAFIGQEPDALGKLPEDPVALLAGQEKEHCITVRVYAKNIPNEWKQLAIGTLQSAIDTQQRNPGESEEDFELRQKIGKGSIKDITQYIEDGESLTIGFNVDEKEKSMHLDFSFAAAEGTQTAKYFSALRGHKSRFAALAGDKSAVALNMGYKLSPNDIERGVGMVKALRDRAMKEIDRDDNLPNDAAKTAVKNLAADAMDVLEKTIGSGTIDGAASLLLDAESLTFLAGGQIADGAKLEETFKKAMDLAKNQPDFPGVKFNADSHKGVTFHVANAPVPDPKAARVLGEKTDVVFGFGADSVYLAVGKDAVAKLKAGIDQAEAGAGAEVQPFRMAIALGPILKFAVGLDDTPNPIAAMLAKDVDKFAGKDRLLISARPIKNGLTYRIEVEQGIISLGGKAIATYGLAGGRRGGF